MKYWIGLRSFHIVVTNPKSQILVVKLNFDRICSNVQPFLWTLLSKEPHEGNYLFTWPMWEWNPWLRQCKCNDPLSELGSCPLYSAEALALWQAFALHKGEESSSAATQGPLWWWIDDRVEKIRSQWWFKGTGGGLACLCRLAPRAQVCHCSSSVSFPPCSFFVFFHQPFFSLMTWESPQVKVGVKKVRSWHSRERINGMGRREKWEFWSEERMKKGKHCCGMTGPTRRCLALFICKHFQPARSLRHLSAQMSEQEDGQRRRRGVLVRGEGSRV